MRHPLLLSRSPCRPCAEDGEHFALAARHYQAAFVAIAATEYRRFHAGQLSAEKMEIVTNQSFLQAGST
jgi:hypothetical protein